MTKAKQRIALINPPQYTKYPQPPMGLAVLGAVLEREGYPVSIIDANALWLQPNDVPRLDVPRLLDRTDVVGITAMTPTISSALAIARCVKQSNPETTVILGGVHPTLLAEKILADTPEVDIVVRGEGETAVVEVLQALSHKRSPSSVLGISYRSRRRITSTPDRSDTTELDLLPYPAYHLLPWRKYRPHPPHGRTSPFLPMMTSRGCPCHCSFCSKAVFGSKYRTQSSIRVVDEIEYFHHRLGIKEIAFYDDVFTLDKRRTYAIADGILRRGLKICWTCESRVNLVDKDLLRHIKQAGCYSIAYGIESGSQKMLDVLDKDATLEQAEEAVRISNEVGLQTVGYFMIGSPGETPGTIKETIEFAKKLILDYAQFAITTPFPGTKLYEIYESGWSKGDPIPWHGFVYSGTRDAASPMFHSNALSPSDIRYWVGRAYKEFYLRATYVWQRLSKVRSAGDIKVLVKGILMLAGNLKR